MMTTMVGNDARYIASGPGIWGARVFQRPWAKHTAEVVVGAWKEDCGPCD